MASSFGVCTTGTTRKAEKISINFEDQIKHSKGFRKSLFPWVRIDQLKKQLAREKFEDHISWTDIRLFYKNIELKPDHKRCFDFGVDFQSIIVIKNVEPNHYIEMGIVNPYQIFDTVPQKIMNLILQVQSGLNNGKKPKLTQEGISGTYFLQNHLKKVVAIFKPFNQEPYADQNPRNYVGKTGFQGIRKGILSGESATREVAAYLLDQSRFHGVPETTYVEFFHPTFVQKQVSNPIPSDLSTTLNKQNQLKTKHGSLQVFKESDDIVGNMGSNQFDVEQIHRIGILDLRILNCDRNEANILVKKRIIMENGVKRKVLKLIPIDHGLSFPDNFQIYDEEIVWMGYRQASQPFSEKSLQFISSIDPVKDCELLRRKLGFREICLRNFRIAQTFLKRVAVEGFTLHQIGEMMYRREQEDSEEEQQFQNQKKEKNLSELEKLVQHAENTYLLVKQNGIESTINFQLNFIKPKKKQESLPELPQSKLNICKDIKVEYACIRKTSLEKKTEEKRQINEREQKCLEKMKKNSKEDYKVSPNKTRNVSLPNLKLQKKQSKNLRGKKNKSKKQESQQNYGRIQGRQKKWDEVFFHYFEDFLERFIQQKKKKKNSIGSRSRLMSQDINYNF